MVTAIGTRYSEAQQIERLKALGFAVNNYVPGYRLSDVLSRFQAAWLTPDGLRLEMDGQYGPETETALFGRYIPKNTTLADRIISVANAHVGIAEVPPGSNSGPQIDLMLKALGLGPGYAWCVAETYCIVGQATGQLALNNPHPKNAGVLNLWALAGMKESGLTRITAEQARRNPALIQPGTQFLLKLSETAGHTGIITNTLPGGKFVTVEGNTYIHGTNVGSREGVLTGRLNGVRSVENINLGYIRYS